jgi:TPR repeat protein
VRWSPHAFETLRAEAAPVTICCHRNMSFSVGSRVCVTGLVAAQHHNGKAATVCSNVNECSGRCTVELDVGGSLVIKPCNLLPIIQAQATAPLSSSFCRVLFLRRSAFAVCASMATAPRAETRSLVEQAARSCSRRVSETAVSSAQLLTEAGGGKVGFLALQMIRSVRGATAARVHKMVAEIVNRVMAARAAGSAEGWFEHGVQLYGRGAYEGAAGCWERAVEMKHARSHALLSRMLIDGRQGVAEDRQRAFELASAGASMGCAHSKGVLANCYGEGYGVAVDREQSLMLGRESAAVGSSHGQFVLGVCHLWGDGVAKNSAEAVRLLRLACAQGHARAQCALGFVLYDGAAGVEPDKAVAVQLWRAAADDGDSEAQDNLAGLLFKGEPGVQQDMAEAIRLLRLSSAQGCKEAMFHLGCALYYGKGVEKDITEAVRLVRLAQAKGHPSAKSTLAAWGA